MVKRRNCRFRRRTRSSEPPNRSDVMTAYRFFSFIAMGACLVLFAEISSAQQVSGNIPDITGSWERARDASIPPQPQAPLKPQYLKELQAKQQAVREANAKGQPIAERVVA